MTQPAARWDGPGYFASWLAPEPVRTNWTAPLAQPGIVPARPLTLGDILTGAFRAVRYAPLTMFGLTLVSLLVAQLLGIGAGVLLSKQSGGSLIPSEVGGLGSLSLFSWSTVTSTIASSLTSIVIGTGLTFTVVEAVSARKVSPGQALERMFRRLGAVLSYSLLTGLAAVLALVLAGLAVSPLFTTSRPESGVLAIAALFLAGVPVGIWLSTKLIFAPCAIAVERLGPIRAIARSWRLTTGLFWRTLGITLLATIIISMAASTVSSVFSFGILLAGSQNAGVILLVSTTASTLTSTVLSLPMTIAVRSLLYVDARIRREGYDLELSEALYG